jgi:hypothetical protein
MPRPLPALLLRTTPFALCLALAVGTFPRPLHGQQEDGYRFGVIVGGTSVLAVVLERLEGRRGLELTVGTWSFRNVSLSGVVKGYLGPSAFRPAIGAGLWTVVGVRPPEGERKGVAVLARFPIGFDWRIASGNYLGLEVDVNRALWIRRADFSDLPPSPRLVPIPGLSYRIMP